MSERQAMITLVTGSNGFVGKNLCTSLRERPGVKLLEHDLAGSTVPLLDALSQADVVFHLAGVNRPLDPSEFEAGNAGTTEEVVALLARLDRHPTVVLASSIQAELDNPYGRSKRAAESVVERYCASTGARGVVHRLKNLFGKWCRPNYNSVTATFCHNVAHGLPIHVSDADRHLDLTYIDDVVRAFVGELDPDAVVAGGGFVHAPPITSHTLTVGELAGLIESFRASRSTLLVPDFSSPFVRALYATYLSYLPRDEFAYNLDIRSDHRGSLAEFVKSPTFGQVFVSRTRPGVTRGNHYHNRKTEKFLVVEGEAVVRFRSILGSGEVSEYSVAGRDYRVVDIPPGYTHSIENVGPGELVTLFWASERFDSGDADTQALRVLLEKGAS